MNRTSSRRHKPKVSDQTLDSQDSGGDDSKECSDESSEDDDDDEDEDLSTDRDTEGSSQGSVGRKREWEALAKYLKSQRAFLERNPPDSFHGVHEARKETKDKMTQKNLTSPMPSMWKPPVYKEVSTVPNFKVIKEVRDKEGEFDDIMLRYMTKLNANNNAYKNECKKLCPHKSSATERIKKLCTKHKKQTEERSKRERHEDIHTCMDAGVSNVALPKEITNEDDGKGLKIRSRCGLPIRCYREPEREDPRKMREKLVYVVEEEGKNAAKMETDLISVNEILAIKQDLLELSEFAKKLKRLKEMKSESEKEKISEAECQCKPLTELIKNVNERMEALEARQEELERGIQKSREMETDTKKTDDTKTSSVSPPLGTVKPEPSAMKSVSSFGKSEMSRVGGGAFSRNLEIVNELLDIKSQLQKLERKRMSKELSPETGPAGFPKTKPKDQTINVFSSKTYILTSDTYKKKKNNAETDAKEKSPHYASPMKEKTAVCAEGQQPNDIVTDWLKNISPPGNTANRLEMHAGQNVGVENELKGEDNWNTKTHTKKNRDRILEGKVSGNQEPQKNRAKDTGLYEKNQARPIYSREVPSYPSRNEGRLFSEEFPWKNKPKERMNRDNAAERYLTQISLTGHNQSFTKPWKTVSSGSIPSVIAVKERLNHAKQFGKISMESKIVKPSRSKSAQEFSPASFLSKDEKMFLNKSRKNLEAKCARKGEKGNENEKVEDKMSRFLRLNREIHPNRSHLVASVNLDGGSSILKDDRRRNPDLSLPLFPFPILPPDMIKILECCEKEHKGGISGRNNWSEGNNLNHKPTKERREKEKVKTCVNKCYKKKKTRVKCSRNHSCNKKLKCSASDLSPAGSSCVSNREAKKHHRRCHKCSKKKHHSKRISSSESESFEENKRGEEHKKKEEKKRQLDKEKCKRPCSCQKKPEPSSHRQTSEKLGSQYQKEEELPTRRPSEKKWQHQAEEPKKSALKNRKYCTPRNKIRSISDDSCYIASFWKNVRKLYPRFSALQLMSWLKLYCQEENQTKKQCRKDHHAKEQAEWKAPREQSKKHECPDCQCCKSYRMTIHQRWPGVSPSSKVSGDSVTEAETRSSVTATETDFMFPYRNPKNYYAFKAANEEDEPEESKKSKKSKASKKSDDELESEEKHCKCVRCGHVHSKNHSKNQSEHHSKKKKKKKVNYEKFCKEQLETEEESEPKPKINKPKKSIFSKLGDVRRLRVCEKSLKCPSIKLAYCRSQYGSKKSEYKPPKNSEEEEMKKIKKKKSKSEGEEIKKEKGKSKSEGEKIKKEKGKSKSEGGKDCNCHAKLMELENRIKNLEKEKKKNRKDESENDHPKIKKKKKKPDSESEKGKSGSTERSPHEKKEKKKEKQKEKKKCLTDEDFHYEEKTEKKKKTKKKDTEASEKSEKCVCPPEGQNKKKEKKHKSRENEVKTFYCDCMAEGFKTAGQSSVPTATEESTPALTQTSTEKSSFRENLQKKKKEVLEKLSSLTTFWRNFRDRRKTNETKTKETKTNEGKTNDDTGLLDDSSRSSEVPMRRSIRTLDEEPTLMRKLKNLKEKKEKKPKEMRVQKTKSKSKRHRFG